MIILLFLWVATFLLAITLAAFVANIAWALVVFAIWCLVSLGVAAYW
jgi:hypothetical protein